MRTIDDTAFFKFLMLPLFLVLLFSLLFKGVLSGFLYSYVSDVVPGVAALSLTAKWHEEGRAIWSVFWLTPPFVVPAVLLLAFSYPVLRKRKVPTLFAVIFLSLVLVGTVWLLWNGPVGAGGGGKLWRIYQGSYLGFLSVTYCLWVSPYLALWGVVKGFLIMLGVGAFKDG
ncbi:hypothetical protein [Pseudomonas sp. PSE14]|uniref:hypothetical protein n=1 Tax=Pseudomonas sp. PSE14 TaxID=3016341 RepID=UPI0023D89438|nr:hypothetical protein [Pseudomonas sp. PSE14]WEJ73448.1 hypothetical protein O6P39_06050 [Pseudomonas sp. PSE14]